MTETARLRAPCGTYGGYQRHRRRGEDTCIGCRAAAKEYRREYRDRGGYAEDRVLNRVRSRALWRLADEHRERFRDLVVEELSKDAGR